MFGTTVQRVSWNQDNEQDKPKGFDTRFTYTKDGLMVYDINAEIVMDCPEGQDKGIEVQDYNVFRNTVPDYTLSKNQKYDYYQKFKSYTNALAPFAGLEFATDHERKIYEFLPPFKKRKMHEKTWQLRVPNTQNSVFFNSEFESGNLQRVVRVNDYEYNLYLEYDKNSRNYTQWYYFSCRNVRKGMNVTFNIINLLKVDSLYNEGMKPCIYSKGQEGEIGTRWHRGGYDISYKKNPSNKTSIITKAIDEINNDDLKKELYKRIKVLYTLTFRYTFKYENDTVFFAHFYPYTFTDMERYLAKTTASDDFKKILRVDILCKSLSNNP